MATTAWPAKRVTLRSSPTAWPAPAEAAAAWSCLPPPQESFAWPKKRTIPYWPPPCPKDSAQWTSHAIADAATAGNITAIAIFERVGRAVGIALRQHRQHPQPAALRRRRRTLQRVGALRSRHVRGDAPAQLCLSAYGSRAGRSARHTREEFCPPRRTRFGSRHPWSLPAALHPR